MKLGFREYLKQQERKQEGIFLQHLQIFPLSFKKHIQGLNQ